MGRKSTSRQARAQAVTGRRSTARKQRAALPDQHYRLMFEHNLIGMYHTTLQGRIIDCNESMARMLGYGSRRDLLRSNAVDLHDKPADRRSFLARLRREGALSNSEIRLRRKDGSFIDVIENVCLVREPGASRPTILGTMVDITYRKQAEESVRASEQRYRTLSEELRRLTQHAHKVREEGRARIARELHDELGQSLTVLNMDLHWLRERLARRQDVPEVRIAAMCALVSQTIDAVRRICTDLRPALLDDLGLVAAIAWQTREFQARTGIRCVTVLPRKGISLSRDQATATFRILQESLTNIARHARATKAHVTLRVNARGLTLQVSDNGVGLPRSQPARERSLGLMGMHERALSWHGHLDVASAPGKGTTITMNMPIAAVQPEPRS